MFNKTLKLAAALALSLGVASTANAAVFTYNLSDHKGASISDRDYGLRLDKYGKFFSFSGPGASAQLIYDDVAKTAKIVGKMVESLAGNGFGKVWDVMYTMKNVTNIGGDGSGWFKDKAGLGSGSVSLGATELALGAKGKKDQWGNTYYFKFKGDGHRLKDDKETLVGRGWVDGNVCQEYARSASACYNDFLFTASKDDGTGGNIPLPAAAWMLLSGVAGLGVMARRRRPS